MYDWLIVGAGFAGSVLAERLARERGDRVLVVEKRNHIGGNAYDEINSAGIMIHKYGPHIFHTNSKAVFEYLSKFTQWRPYEHRVRALIGGKLVPIPINLTTINQLYGLSLTSEEAQEFLANRAESVAEIRTSEDVIVSQVGRELYELFFRGYTRKQWGMDPSELDKSVAGRIPTRTNEDDRYFSDEYQCMPAQGYGRMFEKILNHPNIDIRLNTNFCSLDWRSISKSLIYTGPIDEYFDYRFGPLPYRSLHFEHVTLEREWLQPVAVVNYPLTEKYTRVTEYKHLTGQTSAQTSISYEIPCWGGDPYYPVPAEQNAKLYKKYEALAALEDGVWFVGRLASYRYYNMDQVVGQALATFRRIQEQKAAN